MALPVKCGHRPQPGIQFYGKAVTARQRAAVSAVRFNKAFIFSKMRRSVPALPCGAPLRPTAQQAEVSELRELWEHQYLLSHLGEIATDAFLRCQASTSCWPPSMS